MGDTYTMDDLVEDARSLLQALEIERVHFVGLSMGGMIGQVLALKYPQLLTSLVLSSTASRGTQPGNEHLWEKRIQDVTVHGMRDVPDLAIVRWFTSSFISSQPRVIDHIRRMIAATQPAGYLGCIHAIRGFEVTDRLPGIEVPTLVVVGEQDQSTPVAASEIIRDGIRGAELVILRPASHLANVEQADAFNQALSTFLARVENSSP